MTAPARTPLCPGMEAFIAEAASAYEGAPENPTLAEQRALYDAFSRNFEQARPDGITVEDLSLGRGDRSVPARLYRPLTKAAARLAPCILYMHGGGWVLGSPATHDSITAELAMATGAVVVSIDYRLCPEHVFPAALDDCRTALHALVRDADRHAIDADAIAVAGDSAGGNLAAALALVARDEGLVTLRGQALIYPVLASELKLPSYQENAVAPMLGTEEMRGYWRIYLGGTAITRDPYAAPLCAPDLSNLAPALIQTAGHDPVRDDGHAYAARLGDAGVPVTSRCATDLAHGFLRARHLSPSARMEFDALTQHLRAWFASSCSASNA